MSEDNLNPILNPDCECPTPEAETPSECPTPETVDIPVSVLPDECGTCDEEIVPAAPTVPDLTPTTKCLDIDPAYQFIPAVDKTPGVGGTHYFYELHPACARPMQLCNFCVTEVTCPEDIGLTIRKGFDNTFSVMAEGAEKPLLFWVHDSHLDRVMSEVGYIKVAQLGNYNEWVPRDCVVSGYVISPSVHFPGDDCFLREMPAIGTIPTVVSEEPITSVLDEPPADVTAPVVSPIADVAHTGDVDIPPIQPVSDEAGVTWTATGLPADLVIDPSTGEITGQIQAAGTYPVTVIATDAAGNESDPVTFNIVFT